MGPAQRASKTYLFKSIPNCQGGGCHARVWLPEKQHLSGSLRVSVAYHGGGWTFGDSVDVPDGDVEYLVSQGVIVVGLQYRLAPHVGFEEIREDSLDGYAWVWTDLPRILGLEGKVGEAYVHGWSAGGHIAAMVGKYYALKNVPKPSGLMLVYGALDIPDLFPGKGEQSEQMKAMQAKLLSEPVHVGIPLNSIWAGRGEWYRNSFDNGVLNRVLGKAQRCPPEYNPIQFLDSDYPPTCLLGAPEDTTIPPRQSTEFSDRLAELGVPCSMIWAPGMKHGKAENCDEPEQYAVWLKDCIQPGIRWTLGER